MDSKGIIFNFNLRGEKGLEEIYYGKGAMFSFLFLCMIIMFFIIFFISPFEMNLGPLIFKSFILLVCLYSFYVFIRTPIEIIIEGDNIQFRIFRRYRKFTFERIRLVKIYYFSTRGSSTISIKTKGKSNRYYLWVPRHERERHELFLQLVETLKEKSEGRFKVKFIT